MEYPEKFVRFDEFCPKCEYFKTHDGDEPCHDCLHHPVNLHSRIPTEFKKADETKKNRM